MELQSLKIDEHKWVTKWGYFSVLYVLLLTEKNPGPVDMVVLSYYFRHDTTKKYTGKIMFTVKKIIGFAGPTGPPGSPQGLGLLVLWSSSLTGDSMMDATASQTVSSFVSGRAQVLPPQALLLSLAAPAPIIPGPALPAPVPSLGLENVSNELDELDYAILATFRTLPRMSGGMHTPAFHASDDSILAQLLHLEVPAHIARQAAALFPTDLNAALDWACSSERRHN